jgi:hypothetical protein
LAAYAREFFGERLAVVPIDTDPMPSPESLLGKVIIKVGLVHVTGLGSVCVT